MALERHVTRALISLASDSLSTSVHLSVNLPPSFHSGTQNLVLSGKVRTGSIWADSPVAKWPGCVRHKIDCQGLLPVRLWKPFLTLHRGSHHHTHTPPLLLPSSWPSRWHLGDLCFFPCLFCLISCLGLRRSLLPSGIFPYNCHSRDPEVPGFSPYFSLRYTLLVKEFSALPPCCPVDKSWFFRGAWFHGSLSTTHIPDGPLPIFFVHHTCLPLSFIHDVPSRPLAPPSPCFPFGHVFSEIFPSVHLNVSRFLFPYHGTTVTLLIYS